MLEWSWTHDTKIDLAKLGCATLWFAMPWLFGLEGASAWNVWVCAYATIVASLAALLADAEWEPRANLWVGVWAICAPWALGFSHDAAAVLVNGAGGLLVCVLSALELWRMRRDPPGRFRPGAAARLGVIETSNPVSIAAPSIHIGQPRLTAPISRRARVPVARRRRQPDAWRELRAA